MLESDQGKKCYVSCYETSCMQFFKNKYFGYLYRRAGLIGPIGAVQASQETTVFLFHEVDSALIEVNRIMITELYS